MIKNNRELLTSLMSINFSRKTLLHGVSLIVSPIFGSNQMLPNGYFVGISFVTLYEFFVLNALDLRSIKSNAFHNGCN
jgi:hypothetical protein